MHPRARSIVRKMMAHCKDQGYELTGPLVSGPSDPIEGMVLRIYDPNRDAGCRIIVSDRAEIVFSCEGYRSKRLSQLDDDVAREIVSCALHAS